MKKELLLMTALLFISGASMAQKVVNVDGKAIIDNRDMPAKAITTKKKALTTNGAERIMGTNDLNNLGSEKSNKTVSHYFEVMKTDLNDGVTVNWASAISNCVTYNNVGQAWRLPTQRELMLIWTLHKTLIKKAGLTSLDVIGEYWSATEHSANRGWLIRFSDGYTSSYFHDYNKTLSRRVRCVRDLTPPTK